MPVVAAQDGERIQLSTVYVAFATRHLMLMHESIRLTRGPKECRVRPAIDVLFRSAAVSHGVKVIGIIPSGALDDGTAGLWAVKDQGDMTLVQEPAQRMLSSMPESAIQHVQIDLIGSTATIAQQIAETVGSRVDHCLIMRKHVTRSVKYRSSSARIVMGCWCQSRKVPSLNSAVTQDTLFP